MLTPQSLGSYSAGEFSRGRSVIVEAVWLIARWLLVASWLPGSRHRTLVLRAFGATIGKGVVLRPGLKVKFPWRLAIGDNTWVGEDVWVDNLAPVSIGADCCISQGAYLCTGNHDWSKNAFDLFAKPIRVGNHVWITARATVGPGVTVGEGAVLGLGSVATSDLEPWTIYRGNPAARGGTRSSRKVGLQKE